MTTATKCALCNEPLNMIDDDDLYEFAAKRHHAVCPKRPIEVGDYVRWESGLTPGRWVEGELMDIPSPVKYGIRVADKSDWQPMYPDERGWHLFNTERGAIIRRIPRPAEAQAIRVGDLVRWRPTPGSPWDGMTIDGIAESVAESVEGTRRLTVLRVTAVCRGTSLGDRGFALGSLVDVTMAPGRVEVLNAPNPDPIPARPGPVCAAGCQCGAHAPPASAPALVDGIDREACLTRWMENRLAVEGGALPPNAMTRMQRDVGRAMWLQRYGAARSAELRGKVAAGREADRCRVRVDVQDVES